MTIKTYLKALLDIVFPPRCFSCDKDMFAESEKQGIASADAECHCEPKKRMSGAPIVNGHAEDEAISLRQPRNNSACFSSYICEDCLKNIRYVGGNRCLRCGTELGPFVSTSSDG